MAQAFASERARLQQLVHALPIDPEQLGCFGDGNGLSRHKPIILDKCLGLSTGRGYLPRETVRVRRAAPALLPNRSQHGQ
jgi:hypothetical protein